MTTCLSPSVNKRRLILIGNPENRRVVAFVQAMTEAGHGAPVLFSHLQLLRDPSLLERYAGEECMVRLEAAGENAELDCALLERGYEAARAQHHWSLSPRRVRRTMLGYGQILCPRQYHLGFTHYLQTLQRIFDTHNHWHVLNPPAGVLQLFDKRVLMAQSRQAGIPVPDALNRFWPGPVTTSGALREAMRTLQWPSVFV